MRFDKYLKDKKLTPLENSILDYFNQNEQTLQQLSIQKVADDNFTSKSTIFRLSKKLGFKGYTDMIYRLTNDQTYEIYNEQNHENSEKLVAEINQVFQKNEAILQRFMEHNKLARPTIYIIGTGYSGIMGEYLYKKLLGKGFYVIFSNGADTNALFTNNIQKVDYLVCISKSGETELICDKAAIGSAQQVPILSFTQSNSNRLAQMADFSFVINNQNQYDWNNIETNYFFPMLLLYLEYVVEKCF